MTRPNIATEPESWKGVLVRLLDKRVVAAVLLFILVIIWAKPDVLSSVLNAFGKNPQPAQQEQVNNK